MSDGQPQGEETPVEPFVSQIDSLFAQAWNTVHAPEDDKTSGEGKGSTDAAGDGAQAPAPAAEGVAGTGAAAPAPAEGAIPTAGDPGVGEAANADGVQGGTGDRPSGAAVPGLSATEVTPLFAPARQATMERFTTSFRSSAIAELREEIDPEFIKALEMPPMSLVGNEVPSIRAGAPPEEKTKILDSVQADAWQKGVARMIEREIQDSVQVKEDAFRPTATIIQESFLMFENNPDLIPGTQGFDIELATRFAEIAKTYEVKVNDKVIGYQDINVQPLINSLRADLAKQRGASGATAAARAEQQRAQAASQPRNEQGKFDGPQGGVVSKANVSGDGEEGYDAFWATLKMNPGTLGI